MGTTCHYYNDNRARARSGNFHSSYPVDNNKQQQLNYWAEGDETCTKMTLVSSDYDYHHEESDAEDNR
jgi:hypothetical protein